MHKIDAPGADPSDEFTEGDPVLAVPATTVGAKWLTTVQREIVNVVEDAGITLDDTIDTQLLQAIAILAGGSQVSGFKNLSGNPLFDIWQREGFTSKTYTALGGYFADRWWLRSDDSGGSGAGTVQRSDFTFGAGVEAHPIHFARHIKTVNPTLASGYALGQHIYEIHQFDGETVTWSIYLQTESGTAQAHTMSIVLDYGSGGTADATVVSTSKSVSGTLTRFEVTGTFPSYSGKTLGTNPKVILKIEADSTTHGGLRLALSQLEFGGSSSSFSSPSISDRWEEALRHFRTSYEYGTRPGTASAFAGELIDDQPTVSTQILTGLSVRWDPPMRVIPGAASVGSFNWFGPSSGTVDRISMGGVERTVTSTSLTTTRAPGFANFGASHSGIILTHYVADAEELTA